MSAELKPKFYTSAGMIYAVFKTGLNALRKLHAEHVDREDFGCLDCTVCDCIIQSLYIEQAFADDEEIQSRDTQDAEHQEEYF